MSLLWSGLALSLWIVLMLLMIYQLKWGIIYFVWGILEGIPIARHLTRWIVGLMFLPLTALHELSHAVIDLLAGHRLERISLLPELVDGEIRLGFVGYRPTGDVIFFGYMAAAPLFVGSLVVLGVLCALFRIPVMLLPSRHERIFRTFADVLDAMLARADPIRFYLLFTLANGTMPGWTDWVKVARSLMVTLAILGIATVLAAIVGGSALFGVDNWDWWLSVLSMLAIVFALVAVLDAVVWLVLLPVGHIAYRAWRRRLQREMVEGG